MQMARTHFPTAIFVVGSYIWFKVTTRRRGDSESKWWRGQNNFFSCVLLGLAESETPENFRLCVYPTSVQEVRHVGACLHVTVTFLTILNSPLKWRENQLKVDTLKMSTEWNNRMLLSGMGMSLPYTITP